MDGGDLTGSGSGASADRSGGPPAGQQTLRDDLGPAARPRRSGRLGLTSSAGRDAFFARALNHPIRSLTVIYLLTRIVALGAIAIAARWFQSPAGVGHLHPTVSDLLQKLHKAGLIAIAHRQITICNPLHLLAHAEEIIED